jgi:hypothetical protein
VLKSFDDQLKDDDATSAHNENIKLSKILEAN